MKKFPSKTSTLIGTDDFGSNHQQLLVQTIYTEARVGFSLNNNIVLEKKPTPFPYHFPCCFPIIISIKNTLVITYFLYFFSISLPSLKNENRQKIDINNLTFSNKFSQNCCEESPEKAPKSTFND
jgi:hypothetical protein